MYDYVYSSGRSGDSLIRLFKIKARDQIIITGFIVADFILRTICCAVILVLQFYNLMELIMKYYFHFHHKKSFVPEYA